MTNEWTGGKPGQIKVSDGKGNWPWQDPPTGCFHDFIVEGPVVFGQQQELRCQKCGEWMRATLMKGTQ